MKKTFQPQTFLFIAAALLVVGFAIRLAADAYQIQLGINSAPLSLFVLERGAEYLLPGVICAAAGLFLRRRNRK